MLLKSDFNNDIYCQNSISKIDIDLIKSQISKKSASFGGNFEKKKRNKRYMMTDSAYFNN